MGVIWACLLELVKSGSRVLNKLEMGDDLLAEPPKQGVAIIQPQCLKCSLGALMTSHSSGQLAYSYRNTNIDLADGGGDFMEYLVSIVSL